MTRLYRIAIVGRPTPQDRQRIASVLGAFGAEEEPDIWLCWMSEAEHERMIALHGATLSSVEVR